MLQPLQSEEIMRHFVLLAGAAALGLAGPALGKPGNGHGHGNAYGYDKHGSAHAYGVNGPIGYGVGGCPPGLAKKNNGCMPPGQARKLYRTGQRLPSGYGNAWSYNQIPYELRRQYDLDRNNRYYYGDGYIYSVDPRTRLIESVVSSLLYR
jgi:hypothetical protein